LVREGKKHSVYSNPRTKQDFTVPRHAEINKYTAEAILKAACEKGGKKG
jgi:hypothetical protein